MVGYRFNLDNFRRLNEMFGRRFCDADFGGFFCAFCAAVRREMTFKTFRLQGDEFVLTYHCSIGACRRRV